MTAITEPSASAARPRSTPPDGARASRSCSRTTRACGLPRARVSGLWFVVTAVDGTRRVQRGLHDRARGLRAVLRGVPVLPSPLRPLGAHPGLAGRDRVPRRRARRDVRDRDHRQRRDDVDLHEGVRPGLGHRLAGRADRAVRGGDAKGAIFLLLMGSPRGHPDRLRRPDRRCLRRSRLSDPRRRPLRAELGLRPVRRQPVRRRAGDFATRAVTGIPSHALYTALFSAGLST